MKVLVSIQQDIFGGPHNQWLKIRDFLASQGVSLVFLLPGELPDAAARLESEGCSVLRYPSARLTLRGGLGGGASLLPEIYRDAGHMAAILRDQHVHVVVAAGLANLPAAVAARIAGRPLVWQLLSVFAPAYVRTGLGTLVAAWSDAVMTVGSRCRRAHPPLRLIPSKIVEFFPPVDLHEFAPVVRAERETPDEGGPLVVTVGNLNPHKGHDILWSAASRLWAEGVRLRVRIVGQRSPSYDAEYQRKLSAWLEGLSPGERARVEYITPEASVAGHLRDADIFALPSRSEGVPTALLEGMAMGLPVVAFDIGGVPEVVSHNLDGLIARTPSADNLADALRRLCGDAALRTRLGRHARRTAETRFGAAVCGRRHMDALQKAVGSRVTN